MHTGPPAVPVPALEERARARVGSLLGSRWRLHALLGVGGMASVYAATHRNGKRVAIKVLHPELNAYGEVRQRFLAEGYAANRVGHPGAVSIMDDGATNDGCPFLVMDLLEGSTLDSMVLAQGRLSPRLALEYADQLLSVLVAAHEKSILHRDIKPENLFITTAGELRVLDFGIAAIVDGKRPRTTRAGTPMGTPAFMPPEQARARWELVDARSDIWAVGATLYFCLAGRYVREAESAAEELLLAMTSPVEALKQAAPWTPQIVAAIVDRALAFDPDDRWQTAVSMQSAVREAARLLTEPDDELTPPRGSLSVGASGLPFRVPEPDTVATRAVSHTDAPRTSISRPRRTGVVFGALAALAAAAALVVVVSGATHPMSLETPTWEADQPPVSSWVLGATRRKELPPPQVAAVVDHRQALDQPKGDPSQEPQTRLDAPPRPSSQEPQTRLDAPPRPSSQARPRMPESQPSEPPLSRRESMASERAKVDPFETSPEEARKTSGAVGSDPLRRRK